MASNKSSVEIVIIKGTFSGLSRLFIAIAMGEDFPSVTAILCLLLLGFVTYGLSLRFYVLDQKDLGATKTSAFYSIPPFGV